MSDQREEVGWPDRFKATRDGLPPLTVACIEDGVVFAFVALYVAAVIVAAVIELWP